VAPPTVGGRYGFGSNIRAVSPSSPNIVKAVAQAREFTHETLSHRPGPRLDSRFGLGALVAGAPRATDDGTPRPGLWRATLQSPGVPTAVGLEFGDRERQNRRLPR
jgi:hypothetical protein